MYFSLLAVPVWVACASFSFAHDAKSRGFLRLRRRESEVKMTDSQRYLITASFNTISGREGEEESYWERLLQETNMSVAPTSAPATPDPSPAPTNAPSPSPISPLPTPFPSISPTASPTRSPTESPTASPTPEPSSIPETPPPTPSPTNAPTPAAVTEEPSVSPTATPPTEAPPTGNAPTESPPTVTLPPTQGPTEAPPTGNAPTESAPVVTFPPVTAPPSPTLSPVVTFPPVTESPSSTTEPTPGATTVSPTVSPIVTPLPTVPSPTTPQPTPGAQTSPPTTVPTPTVSPVPTPPPPTPDVITQSPTPPSVAPGSCDPSLLVECFDEQGVVCDVAFPEGGNIGNTTSPQTLIFNYTISNEGDVPLAVQTLISNFTEGSFMFSQRVNFTGVAIPSGESLPPLSIRVNDVPIDEGRKSFLVETIVLTENDAGDQCSDEDTSEFFFGFDNGITTPSTPTSGALTPSPTSDSFKPPTSAPSTLTPTSIEVGTPVPTNSSVVNDSTADILVGDDRFTTLVSLADDLGIISGLETGGPLTIFAPTNEAFVALNLPPNTDQDAIRDVLFYHVAEGEVELEDGLVVESINGATVELTVTNTQTKVNDVNITEVFPASNGVVYVIDEVLLPPTTPAPTPEPTTPEPTEQALAGECALDVDVQCFSSNGVSCEEALPETLECGLQSTSLSFKYIGGDCDESSNSQTVFFYGCVNGGGGNVPSKTDPVQIVVISKDSTLLFNDTVEIGQVYTVSDGGERLSDLITISVFDGSSSDATLLQTVQMNPSCQTSLLFLNDRYGANQVVGWETEEQGVVDSTVDEMLTFIYTVTNIGNVDAQVQSLVSNISEEGGSFGLAVDTDFTDAILAPNASFPFTQDIPDIGLDDGRKTFAVETEVTGDNLDGSACTVVDESEFSFGFA